MEEERWYRTYDEQPAFGRGQLLEPLKAFLRYAGYEIRPADPIGFMKPDLAARREADGRTFELIFVVREAISQAVEAFRELAAAKCFRRDTLDYVLVLPPVSEHTLIEFLIEKEAWFFPIKDQLMQIWLVHPEREKVDCLIGWPRDDDFRHYFSNPKLAGFATFIANKAAEKILAEEFG